MARKIGICQICEKPTAIVCENCDAAVCLNHFDAGRGVCIRCIRAKEEGLELVEKI